MSWAKENSQRILSLCERQLETINIIEMAILEEGKDGLPQYQHQKCPFIQAQVIEWIFVDGVIARFQTYQNCDRWGIKLDFLPASAPRLTWKNDPQSIYRLVANLNLPTGIVHKIDLELDSEANVSRINFMIGKSELLFVAGEVYEDWDDIYILLEDESILVFLDPSQVNNVIFGRAIDA